MRDRFPTFMAMVLLLLVLFVSVTMDVYPTPLAPEPVPRDQAPLAMCEIELPSLLAPPERGSSDSWIDMDTTQNSDLQNMAIVHDGRAVCGPGVRPSLS